MPNRLSKETSPYLQQHAENPVDWYPWGEEALEESKRTGKPILLSVGYSACHWCHVMAHESFEDPAIARVMNELYVNIKVDREERPDIDQIYQVAQAMLTQRNGGWPLTMFLTPAQLPFFGGTYFPNTARYGMPGFGDLLKRVREVYDEHRDELAAQGEQVREALARTVPRADQSDTDLSRDPIDAAADHLRSAFDREHGGYAGAPKFPHPDTIAQLMRYHAATGDKEALALAIFTLTKMAEGGIYDQVGGGFSRYSVDAQWTIPHFEKMLYDNGWLLGLYADAWAITREPLFERVCRGTAGWVMREMQSPGGGYYSSLDADSEHEEGKFYVWEPEEIRSLLTAEEYQVASIVFGLDRPPNFENRHWHLRIARPIAETARAMEINEGAVQALLDAARAKLAAARDKRVRPGRDDKILASWNALMIAGMARAARVFGRDDWLASARSALDFIRTTLWADGRMMATARGVPPTGTGSIQWRAHLDAYLDDHAYLLAALLEMLQARFDARDLRWATEIAEVLMAKFHDREAGGFFFTAHDHEALIHRPKPGPDNATPSGNAVAALALNRLAFLTGQTRYSDAAKGTVALFRRALDAQPAAFGTLLAALEEQVDPPRTLIVRGATEAFAPWRELLDRAYLPATLVLFIPAEATDLPAPLAKGGGNEVTAWLCEGFTCLPPIRSREELRAALRLATIPAPHTAATPHQETP